MKVSMFHLFSHRELPADFEKRYRSVWVDAPWWELADPARYGQYYLWAIEELVHAARAGFDGICTNEHHQNAYGGEPNPNLMGAILAWATRDLEVAIVQMGSTLPTTIPPIRVAEEYAHLDCLSGGRLVAGMPIGTAMDANFCYGIPPIEQRERYYEAHDLIVKAWTANETFVWNGKYFQLPMVNLWPRPVQKPHPPIWVPGITSLSTWEFVLDHGYAYACLTTMGTEVGKRVMQRFWEFASERGAEPNPYRAGFALLCAVSETDAQAEKEYKEHAEYFLHKLLHIAPEFTAPPGYQDYRSLLNTLKGLRQYLPTDAAERMTYRKAVDSGMVIAGAPDTVRERLIEFVRSARIGHLMLLMHFGSMPKELTVKNIDLFCGEVLPHLEGVWEEEGWENLWWPERLRGRRSDRPVRVTD